jgi:hypothetical protein
MLKIGENTYIDVEFVDDYISKLTKTNPEAKAFWDELEDAEKEYYIMYSMAVMDNQKYIGQRAFRGQPTEFPRIPRGSRWLGYWDLTTFEGYEPFVKTAQTEVLIGMLDIPVNQARNDRLGRRREGVVAFSLDGFSETYDKLKPTDVVDSISPKAFILLTRWLDGSFSVV